VALVLVLLLVAGCATFPGGAGDPAEEARRQAEQMLTAIMKGDYTRSIEFSDPAAVEAAFGSRENAIAALRRSMKEIEDAGGKWYSVTAERATQVVSEGGKMYAVVPTKIGWKFRGYDRSGTSYVVGVSPDEGKTWKFFDGLRLLHAETRQKYLPSLPSSIVLPMPTMPVR
jgi:hypothetical protein